MFEGFETRRIETGETTIHLRCRGDGPPLLLLHGYPQNHVMWHRLAPILSERFAVVCPDLRGYGDSGHPDSAPDHATYSKRAMADDMVRVMEKLGYDSFMIAGHDRGGRVTHRLALDHPESVLKAAVLDIVPTHKIFTTIDRHIATAYYHWFFLIQPDGLPERMIGQDPEYYLREKLRRWSHRHDAFDDEVLADYVRCFSDPRTIHASCEDYRAAASIDLVHDEADIDRQISCPLLVLWGDQGLMARSYDILATWRERASDVRGLGLPCGHFLVEEAPDETLSALSDFFSA